MRWWRSFASVAADSPRSPPFVLTELSVAVVEVVVLVLVFVVGCVVCEAAGVAIRPAARNVAINVFNLNSFGLPVCPTTTGWVPDACAQN